MKRFWLVLVIFSLTGQIAWVVENMYFNVFIYKMFHASAGDISLMVAASAVAATLTTIIMGALSDKVGKRRIFMALGYILWGISIIGFAFLRFTPLTRALDNPFSRCLGKVTLAMYICHYTLITAYLTWLQKGKAALAMHSREGGLRAALFRFLGDTGGMDRSFKPAPMGWKDIVLYLALLLAVAIAVNGLIWALGRLFRAVREKRERPDIKPEEP